MKFGSPTLLALAFLHGCTEAWLQQPLFRRSIATITSPTTALHMYMGARNSTTRDGTTRMVSQEVLEEETPATEQQQQHLYDEDVSSFSEDMQDQLEELEQMNHNSNSNSSNDYKNNEAELLSSLDAHQSHHFLVSDQTVDENSMAMELPNLMDNEFIVSDTIEMDETNDRNQKMELPIIMDHFVVSENIQMDPDHERSHTMEMPALTDPEFVVSENIAMDETHERQQRMALPQPELSVDITQDFHISENMEDRKAQKMELHTTVDDVFVVSNTIQSDETNERSQQMELPQAETSVDVTEDFHISENMEDRKAQKLDLTTTTHQATEDHFVVSDNEKDTKPITVMDKDFRISDPIAAAGEGTPVAMPELVDGHFLVSDNIQSQDRARSKRVKISSLPTFAFLDNLQDMDLIPSMKMNMKTEDVQKIVDKAHEGAKALLEFGKVVAKESVVMAQDVQKSLPTTTVGKHEETYEEALHKVGKGATGLWTLMKEFGGFVKERAAQVDMEQAESMLDGIKVQAVSTMENLQTRAKSVRIPDPVAMKAKVVAQEVEDDEDTDLDLPYFLK